MSILSRIRGPRDLDALSATELSELASEIREFLVNAVARTGGHLGPNLGAVEATIAIHRVFDSPKDSIIFDTGHQSYVHKLLTGRQDFSRLRQSGGIAGYPQRAESIHDIVESSHASSSLSWADGIARANANLGHKDRHVVAFIGDGALTGGMAWEALNNITDGQERRLTVVVNDNGRSYAPTIGGFARYLNEVRTVPAYGRAYRLSRRVFEKFGLLGRLTYSAARGAGKGLLATFAPKGIFPNLDLKYIGPIDGHDLQAVETALRQAKQYGEPSIVHLITQKGKGFDPAMLHQDDQFHAVGQIDPKTGESLEVKTGPSWTKVFAEEIVEIARQNPRVVGITGAMQIPVGLDKFAKEFPSRVIDVGIAEQHAVASAAGLAYGGLHPVVAVYATFMNRAFDQVLMDVALHKAGVTFVLDRAGVTGPDGASHHGMWDLALFQLVPNIKLAAPRDADSLRELLREAVAIEDRPTMLRFGKGVAESAIPALSRTSDGVDILSGSGEGDVLMLGVGSMSRVGLEAAQILAERGFTVTVADPRWVVPVPRSILELARNHKLVVTIEDGIKVGGVGTRVRQDLRDLGIDTALTEIGLPDEFLPHATREEILESAGLTPAAVAQQVIEQFAGRRSPSVQ